jgi:transposase
LPEVPIEVPDPLFEQLVQEGKAERIGFEESSKLAYERGGLRRVVIKRVKYAATSAQGETQIETAAVPAEIIPRCMASTLALIATSKYCDGLPLFRIEQMFERWGFPLDRGTMSRWLEQLGATFGATVIETAKCDALATVFCMMTDATGFAVQPGPSDDGVRRPCRKGHYFVMIADRDHIFFEFTPKETSENVRAIFKGLEGYLQADVKSVYDVLFRPPEPGDPDDDGCTRIELGCWSHYLDLRVIWRGVSAAQFGAASDYSGRLIGPDNGGRSIVVLARPIRRWHHGSTGHGSLRYGRLAAAHRARWRRISTGRVDSMRTVGSTVGIRSRTSRWIRCGVSRWRIDRGEGIGISGARLPLVAARALAFALAALGHPVPKWSVVRPAPRAQVLGRYSQPHQRQSAHQRARCVGRRIQNKLCNGAGSGNDGGSDMPQIWGQGLALARGHSFHAQRLHRIRACRA